MNQKRRTLEEEMDEALVADAKERNPGVNPDSVTMTRRERIMAGVAEARLSALVDQRVRAETNRLQKLIQQDDGA